MKKTVRYSLLALAAVSITAAWLSLGLFQDREFSTIYLFTKHRASLKIFFYAPLGESDNRIESLSPKKQNEEKAFDEFVYKGGGYDRRIRLFSP
jgi:hypothetical protein